MPPRPATKPPSSLSPYELITCQNSLLSAGLETAKDATSELLRGACEPAQQAPAQEGCEPLEQGACVRVAAGGHEGEVGFVLSAEGGAYQVRLLRGELVHVDAGEVVECLDGMLLARSRHRSRRAPVDHGRPRSDGAAPGASSPSMQRKSVGCSARSTGSGFLSVASSQSTGLSEGSRLMLPPSSMLQILEGEFSGKLARVLLVNAAQGQYKVRVVPDNVVRFVSSKDVQLAPSSERSTCPGNKVSTPRLAPTSSPRLEEDLYWQAAPTQTVPEHDVPE